MIGRQTNDGAISTADMEWAVPGSLPARPATSLDTEMVEASAFDSPAPVLGTSRGNEQLLK